MLFFVEWIKDQFVFYLSCQAITAIFEMLFFLSEIVKEIMQ